MENQIQTTQPTNGIELLTALKTTSVIKAVELSKGLTPLLRQNYPALIDTIKLMVLDIVTFYREPYTDEDLKVISELMYQNMRHCTMADLATFKNQCLSGHYPLKFRLTPNVFIDWIKEYVFERNETFATQNQVKPVEQYSDKTIGFLKVFANKIKIKEPETKPDPETDYQIELRKLSNELIKEFNLIWRSQDTGETGARWIDYNGKKYNIEMYLLMKLNHATITD